MARNEIALTGTALINAELNLPTECHDRQMKEGRMHPRSGCDVCHMGGMFGCIYKMEIPTDIYYSLEHDNFYSVITHGGLGQDFYKRWKIRSKEFPQTKESVPVNQEIKPKFQHHAQLDYSKPDSADYIPDTSMITKSYFHPKTRRIYTVDGFIWDSDLDRWKVHYTRTGCITAFARLPEVFAEKFVEIEK